MAQLPVPGRRSATPGLTDGSAFAIPDLPEAPRQALRRLTDAGHDAVLVGGSLRDLLLGGHATDWDLATSALPEVVHALFPGSTWENRFGTVTVRSEPPVEITSYRAESGYRDRRRPDEVRFGGSLADDLGRRDLTINAIAWRPDTPGSTDGHLVDPFGGLADLRDGVIRAVGDPAARFGEDALRVLRAVRFSLRLGFSIDAATEAALADAAPSTAVLSGERVRDELRRLLADPAIRPSAAFARWEAIGLLRTLLPELVALRGIPQGKPLPGDALDHSLRTADALPPDDAILRLTGLLHDLGKATTFADGHFIGHEEVGAQLAEALMRRLRFDRAAIARVTHLVRHHMFGYEPAWTDAAVRRFIRRVGMGAMADLLALRAADNAGSGVREPAIGGLDELRARIEGERRAPIGPSQLALDGHDLQHELGMEPGAELGSVLDRLLEIVIDDPSLNEREVLLDRARTLLRER